jgi:predicted dehydrogenase
MAATAPPSSQSASRPLRTGIIGYGLAGRVFHAPFVASDPAFDLVVIATSDAGRQRDAQERYSAVEVAGTPEELLAGAFDLDLVVLASPPHAHREQGIAALAAGAAVVVDKPFVPSVEDAEALIAASDSAGRPLIVFQNRRWDGDFLTVRRLLEENALGNVQRFESTFERWFAPPKPGAWQGEITVEQGGGILFDLGSHLIDQALQLFGPVAELSAEFRVVQPHSVTEDDAFVSLLHENGVRSHLTMSRAAAQTGPRFRVLGNASGYSVYGLDGQEAALQGGASPTDSGYGVTPPGDWGVLGIDDDARGLDRVPTERGDYAAFYRGVEDTRAPVQLNRGLWRPRCCT